MYPPKAQIFGPEQSSCHRQRAEEAHGHIWRKIRATGFHVPGLSGYVLFVILSSAPNLFLKRFSSCKNQLKFFPQCPLSRFLWHICDIPTPSFFFFWWHPTACEILVPQPGIRPRDPTVKALSPNHWTAREFYSTLCRN